MPELSPEERLNVMRNNADKVEREKYEKELTEEELVGKSAQFVENSIAVSNLEDELADKKKEFKNKIDPIKLTNRVLQYELKTKKRKVEGQLFHMADQVNSMMEVYDESGELVSSRRLRPEEKIHRPLSFIKPAANQ